MAKKRKTLPKEIDILLKNGDVEELKKMFSRCEPNALRFRTYGSNIFSCSPLPREFAFWAKEQGADVNFIDYYGDPPIFRQVSAWDGDVQLLIDLGANIHVTQYDGCTPLHNAAVYGRANAVRALLAAGAEVDAKAKSCKNNATPLEMALSQHRTLFADLWEVSEILLEYGAKITDAARASVRQMGEDFERSKRGNSHLEFLSQQAEAMKHFYERFDVEPAEEVAFHDGVSPIVIEEKGFAARFNKLWDYLIPVSGRAQTAQGEALRIAGRVEDELSRNGGGNWDDDYRSMLRIFPEYLKLGNPLSETDIAEAKHLSHILQSGRLTRAARRLCELAVKWILQNPEVIQPLEADYDR